MVTGSSIHSMTTAFFNARKLCAVVFPAVSTRASALL